MNIIVKSKNIEKSIKIDETTTLLEILRKNGFNIPALCGGNGTCGKCKIKILTKIPVATKLEKEHLSESELNSGIRLSCLHKPDDGMIIEINDKKNYNILSDFDVKKLYNKVISSNKKYSIAVDIGTTTVAIAFLNLCTGEIIYNKTFLNPQQQYGADVISRIDYINNSKTNTLTKLIVDNIDNSIKECCIKNKISSDEIGDIIIVGNTTMLYILQNLNPHELAVSPFTATYKDMKTYKYCDLFSSYLNSKVILLPCVSAYIGADITSGMYFLGKELIDKKILFIDLGTNGEIVLSNGKNIYCASAAAGPAFEGACIKDGVGSIDGAICNIKIEDKEIKYNTINNKEPVGICGSAIIDITAEGIKNSLINETGKLENKKIQITKDISFYQKDIREVQLAKSAIYSGIKVLLDEAGININEIEKLYLAGGFGKHINIENACKVGIIPSAMKDKSETVGNSSLGGAVKYLLNTSSRDKVYQIINKCRYVELSMDKRFNNYFIENMGF